LAWFILAAIAALPFYLSGLNLSDVLIIRKWIDYARGIGDPSVDLLNQNTVYYQNIYDQAKARLDTFNFSY